MRQSARSLFLACCLLSVVQSMALQVYNDNQWFWAPEKGSYIESHFLIPTESIQLVKAEDGRFFGKIKVRYEITRNDSVILVDQYNLQSPLYDSLDIQGSSFSDTRRKKLDPGKYVLHVQLTDLYDSTNHTIIHHQMEVGYLKNQIVISGINLIARFESSLKPNDPYARSGFIMYPYVLNYYPTEQTEIRFYTEIYHTNQQIEGEQFLCRFSLTDNDGEAILPYSGYQKMQTARVNVLFTAFNVQELPTGNYHLLIEVVDPEGSIRASRKVFLQRLNKEMTDFQSEGTVQTTASIKSYNSEELSYHIESLFAIALQTERKEMRQLNKDGTLRDKQAFFLGFWRARDSIAPIQAWELYQRKVDEVNRTFGTPYQRGFETDRGIVYLKYGPPNDRQRDREPGGYTYEVWQYNKLPDGQTDIRFVFYNPTQITNDMELLHSNGIGEISDSNWKEKIFRDKQNPNNIRGNQMGETLDREITDF